MSRREEFEDASEKLHLADKALPHLQEDDELLTPHLKPTVTTVSLRRILNFLFGDYFGKETSECIRESILMRSIPGAALGATLAHIPPAMAKDGKKGILRYVVATSLGWFAGKMSYAPECYRRVERAKASVQFSTTTPNGQLTRNVHQSSKAKDMCHQGPDALPVFYVKKNKSSDDSQ